MTLLAAHLDRAVRLTKYWRKFNDVRFHAEVFQRASGFQPQQTAADHRPALAATGAGFKKR